MEKIWRANFEILNIVITLGAFRKYYKCFHKSLFVKLNIIELIFKKSFQRGMPRCMYILLMCRSVYCLYGKRGDAIKKKLVSLHQKWSGLE